MLSRRQFLAGTAATGMALATGRIAPARADSKRLIVDSQIHMWPPNRPDRPWVAGAKPQIPEPMTIERVVPMIDEAGVDRVVIVPPTLDGERIDYAQEAVKRYPGRFGIMARIALDQPDRAARLPTWREQPGVLGVRLNVGARELKWFKDGMTDWFWPAAEKANVPVMFLSSENQVFMAIAERHPKLQLIIDHMGVPSAMVRKKMVAEAIAVAAQFAKYPNVSVKLSATPLMSNEPYPWRDMTDRIHRLYDVFGPQRCYWGTDVTNSYNKATYRQRVTHFTEELPFLSESDKDWIMGKAIVAKLRWT
jgi:predicted TIM-barrel fold metal-dependent hydrolase